MNTTETIEKLKEILTWFAPHQEYPRNAIQSAVTLLQNTEKDTERLDWLETQWRKEVGTPSKVGSVSVAVYLGGDIRPAIDAIAAQQEAQSV